VVYVVRDANTGQVHLHPVTGNEQANAEQQEKANQTFIPHIILASFMLPCLFGLIALVLARKYSASYSVLSPLFLPVNIVYTGVLFNRMNDIVLAGSVVRYMQRHCFTTRPN